MHTYHYWMGRGEEKVFLLYLQLGKLRKNQTINDWEKLPLDQLSVKSRKTYCERVCRMVELGMAEFEGFRLRLFKKDRIIQGDPWKEKFITVENDKNVQHRIRTEIIRPILRAQGYQANQTEKRQSSQQHTVLTLGNAILETQSSPSYVVSLSCIKAAEHFGFSSSYSGWVILKKLEELGFIAIYKRYIPIEENYRSVNWRKQKMSKPILNIDGRLVNPISSMIDLKMPRAKKGVAGLHNPKNRVVNRLQSLYGDITDLY